MNINSQIKEMTTKEKLMAMELLWDELCHESKEISSPEWHEPVLKQRIEEAKSDANFESWTKAKDNIRKSLK